ncbi:MAG: prolyl oligopeptidase family serine peptidase [Thermaerobacter sp.]|nr:prolyl oligopeptidase family serine peptidase [Thermaerobacter sp.]
MQEERIRVAVDHWAPRMIANGVDLNDFHRLTGAIEHWADWCGAWSEAGAAHAERARQAEAAAEYVSAGEHYFHAAITYHFGKFLFFHDPAQLRTASEETARNYARGLPYYDWPGERIEIPYQGTTMPGIFRKPWHVARPPVVIIIPGLDSVKEEMHHYGHDFLRRGMAVLAIDGPGQGEMEFEHRMRHDYEVPVAAAIDALERRGDIDAARIGLLGVSLGGYYAPRAAAFEPRVSATIAVSGCYRVTDYFDRVPVLTREAFVHRLKAQTVEKAFEEVDAFDLTGIMQRLDSPLLVVHGSRDRLFPPQSAERMVQEAGGPATLWMFEDGNHVCNNIPYKYRPAQADWMARQLRRQ